MVDRITTTGQGNTEVGGFTGILENGTITRCFSAGSVVGNGKVSSVKVGGITGQLDGNNTINNCVALGSSITGISPGTQLYTGRIIGLGNTTNLTNNYAVDTLKVWRQNISGILNEATLDPAEIGTDKKHGATIQRVRLNSTFWTSTLTDYTSTVWDTGTPVTRNGYPTLRGVGGQQ